MVHFRRFNGRSPIRVTALVAVNKRIRLVAFSDDPISSGRNNSNYCLPKRDTLPRINPMRSRYAHNCEFFTYAMVPPIVVVFDATDECWHE